MNCCDNANAPCMQQRCFLVNLLRAAGGTRIGTHGTKGFSLASPHALVGKLILGITIVSTIFHAALTLHADQSAALVDRAIALSGLSGQLDRLGPTILGCVPDDAFGDDEARRRALRSLNRSVDEKTLNETLREAVLEEYDEAHLKAVVEFYESRLGREVSRLSSRALSPWMLKEVDQNPGTFHSMSLSRQSLMEELIRAGQVVEFNTQLLTTVVHGLAEGSLRKTPTRGFPLREIRQQLDAIVAGIRKDETRTRETALETYAHALRSLKDAELSQLVEFRNSPQGRWFTRVTHTGLDRAVFRVAAAIGEIMAGTVGPADESGN